MEHSVAYTRARGHQGLFYGHTTGDLAAANGNVNGGMLRDLIAKEMKPFNLSAAQELACECVRKKYEGC